MAPWPRVKSWTRLTNPVTGCLLAATLAAKPCTNTFAVCEDWGLLKGVDYQRVKNQCTTIKVKGKT